MRFIQHLSELLEERPIVPFIRESDYAVRRPWRAPNRRLLDYLLIYIQEGQCLFQVDGTAYLFQSGEFCLIQPGSLVELEGLTSTITPFAHLDFFYHPDRTKSFPTKPGQLVLQEYEHLLQPRLNDIHGIHVPVKLELKNPGRFRDYFMQMVEAWQNREPIQQLKAQHLATELLLIILDEHHSASKLESSPTKALSWFPSYLSNHLSERLTLQGMAKRANLSVSRFSTLFKQQFGSSPHQYFLEMRINHARELLEKTELTLEQIASYCGFANIHHFSKAYKKRMGKSPGKLRIRGDALSTIELEEKK
ncbi:AraC-like DNA-binding protein [Bacillus tianshenii]|uniref:AraC-like DNA-binding protein n=1 Tax=Sutcliffiella tianshenii TaxID=1463404 RepID=A0ABS2NYV6_9BACI|nr:AraC-like DNA-binding protein [Bacillus tianshenii]